MADWLIQQPPKYSALFMLSGTVKQTYRSRCEQVSLGILSAQEIAARKADDEVWMKSCWVSKGEKKRLFYSTARSIKEKFVHWQRAGVIASVSQPGQTEAMHAQRVWKVRFVIRVNSGYRYSSIIVPALYLSCAVGVLLVTGHLSITLTPCTLI